MKVFWAWLAKILLVVAVVEAWFLYDMNTKNQQLIADNIELEKQLLDTQDSLSTAQAKIEELEKHSIEGMLKETNKAVVSGWETLLNAVESELKKARKSIDSTIDELNSEPDIAVPPPANDEGQAAPDQPVSPDSVPQTESEQNSIPQPIQGERT